MFGLAPGVRERGADGRGARDSIRGWIQDLRGNHMKSGILGAFATLFLGAGWALAQGPAPSPSPSGVVMPSAMEAQPSSNSLNSRQGLSVDDGPMWYGSAEYLLWRVDKGRIPSANTTLPVGLISVDVTNSSTTDRTIPGTPDANHVFGYAPVSITSTATWSSSADCIWEATARFQISSYNRR